MNTCTHDQKPSGALMAKVDSLMGATDAYKNTRALLLLGMTLVSVALVGGVFSTMGVKAGSPALAGMGMLLALILGFYGVNAVGILMMHDAQGHRSTSMVEAVLLSLYTSHRLLGVMVLEFVIVLLAILAIALVLFICKIPVLGPVLFTVVFPATAIILGVLVFSLFYVLLPLAGPAVWSGHTVMQVIARLNGVARKKLVSVIFDQILLMVITSFTAGIIFFVVMTGTMLTTGLSSSIIGMGDMGIMGLFSSMSGFGGPSGHMVAGAIGGGLLFAIAGVIPMLIFAKGACLIYLKATCDLDLTQLETELANRLDNVKKKAEDVRERGRQFAEQHRPQGAQPVPVTPGAPVANTPSCPNCHAPTASDDLFCGECGSKLS